MLKYYLRGLGIGIIVTTLILTVVFNLKGKLSDSEIKERAAKLGMVMAETTEDSIFDKTSSDKENETQTKPAESESSDKETAGGKENEESTPGKSEEDTTPEQTTEAPTSEPETETPAPTTEEATTEAPTPEPATEAPVPSVISASIEIKSGMYSEAVSRLLFESGIVPNAAEFNLYLENNGYAERISTGTFKVSSDMSYEQLARIITRS